MSVFEGWIDRSFILWHRLMAVHPIPVLPRLHLVAWIWRDGAQFVSEHLSGFKSHSFTERTGLFSFLREILMTIYKARHTFLWLRICKENDRKQAYHKRKGWHDKSNPSAAKNLQTNIQPVSKIEALFQTCASQSYCTWQVKEIQNLHFALKVKSKHTAESAGENRAHTMRQNPFVCPKLHSNLFFSVSKMLCGLPKEKLQRVKVKH